MHAGMQRGVGNNSHGAASLHKKTKLTCESKATPARVVAGNNEAGPPPTIVQVPDELLYRAAVSKSLSMVRYTACNAPLVGLKTRRCASAPAKEPMVCHGTWGSSGGDGQRRGSGGGLRAGWVKKKS